MKQTLLASALILSALAANARDPRPEAVRRLTAGWTARSAPQSAPVLTFAEGAQFQFSGAAGEPTTGFAPLRGRRGDALYRFGRTPLTFPSNDGSRTFRASPQCWMTAEERPLAGVRWTLDPEASGIEARRVRVHELPDGACRAGAKPGSEICAVDVAVIATRVRRWAFFAEHEDGELRLDLKCVEPHPLYAPSWKVIAQDFEISFQPANAPAPAPEKQAAQ